MLKIGSKRKIVSIDRLKPAFIFGEDGSEEKMEQENGSSRSKLILKVKDTEREPIAAKKKRVRINNTPLIKFINIRIDTCVTEIKNPHHPSL